MPRAPLPIGAYGKITSRQQKNGSWRASTRYRDQDGITRPVHRFGSTRGRAEGALRTALLARSGGQSESLITRETRLAELAELWLAEKALQQGVTQQTLDLYRREIDVSTDKRADPNAVKIKSALGGLRVREATTSRLDAHLKKIVAAGHREKARRQRVILSEMMRLAVRHDAIDRNPVREVADLPRERRTPRAADLDTLAELRAHLLAWVQGRDGEGDTYHGPRRNPRVLDVAEVELGTGPRPGEVLALRWRDVDLEAVPPTITFAGTIVRLKGVGLIRQPRTKSDAGFRTVMVPGFAAEALRRVRAHPVPSELDLVFPNRDGGIWDPHNFGRLWRQARGEQFAWVTAKTFRKTVASLIAEEYGLAAAARQLGHANETVTRRHYVDQPSTAPDFTAALDRLHR
ncbi:tyrosine-type recombinase/integrase [Nocardia thailandica]|uniref:Tyrosine-type recombinase/integrase n=1 Tax=Nocardia thailandica TaxID=257275 RepID=A0ABW6PI14_9NOCA